MCSDRTDTKMLNSIKSRQAYLSALAALAAENANAASSATASNGSNEASHAIALQKIKNAIAVSMLKKDVEIPAWMERVDVSEKAEEIRRIETFNSTIEVLAGFDETSTQDSPVIYMEIKSGDETNAYRVAIDSIDATKMSNVEAFALIRYMQSDPEWSDVSYADMLAAITVLYSNGAETSATNAGMVDRIGRYLKTSNTYTSTGTYSKSTDSSVIEFFDQTSADRMNLRALKLRGLLSNVVTGQDGKKSLADGFYL